MAKFNQTGVRVRAPPTNIFGRVVVRERHSVTHDHGETTKQREKPFTLTRRVTYAYCKLEHNKTTAVQPRSQSDVHYSSTATLSAILDKNKANVVQYLITRDAREGNGCASRSRAGHEIDHCCFTF